MAKYVALLRGINVGGHHKIEMSRLKKMFLSLGFSNVSTYINSGNVIFESHLEPSQILLQIDSALILEFGFKIGCLIRDSKNIQSIAETVPLNWQNDTEQKTDVLFLWEQHHHQDVLKQIYVNPKVDILSYFDGALIWHIDRKNYYQSGLNKFISTPIYKNMTARNINTVRKLAQLLS